MLCKCKSKTLVKDTRETDDGKWRKHECKSCGMQFTTLEQVCETIPGIRGRTKNGWVKAVRIAPTAKNVTSPNTRNTPTIKAIDRGAARRHIEALREKKELEML